MALEVELEEIEEGAGDEGAEHETAAALHHALKRHDETHLGGGKVSWGFEMGVGSFGEERGGR